MRTMVILLGLALVVPLIPAAEASHMGPCWHEYIEGAKYLASTVKSCNQRLFDWLGIDTVISCGDPSVCVLLP